MAFTSDETCGVSSNKFYTHAVNFGSDTAAYGNVTVNGVKFHKHGVAGGNGATTGFDGRTYVWTNFPGSAHGGDTSHIFVPSNQQVYRLLKDMHHTLPSMSGNPASGVMEIAGLTPGAWHEAAIFYRCWGNTANRDHDFYFDPDAKGTADWIKVRNSAPDLDGNSYVAYRYQADAKGKLRIRVVSPDNGNLSLCLWAFTNERLAFELLEPEDVTTADAMLHSRLWLDPVEIASQPVTLWWGTADGGTNTAAWANGPANASPAGGGKWSWLATGLQPDTKYVYRFKVTTIGGLTFWSAPGTFTTRGAALEIAMLRGKAESLATASADVHLKWAGASGSAGILVCYGDTADHGANVNAWLADAGVKKISNTGFSAGVYNFPLTLTAENTTYFCRAFAFDATTTNAAPTSLALRVATLTSADVRTLYWGGGYSDIPCNTPLPKNKSKLHGRWDATTKNWAIDAQGSAYVAWSDAPDRVAVFPHVEVNDITSDTTVTVVVAVDADVTLNKIVIENPTTTARGYQFTPPPLEIPLPLPPAPAPRVIKLDGVAPGIDLSVAATANLTLTISDRLALAAPNGFEKRGAGILQLGVPASTTAATLPVEGRLQLNAAGFMANPLEIWLRPCLYQPGGAYIDADLYLDLPVGANDKINDNAAVRMSNNATLQQSNGAAGRETFRKIILDAHGQLTGFNQTRGTITVSEGIDRGAKGIGTLYIQGGTSGNLDTLFPNVVVSNLTAGVFLPWVHTQQSNPVWLDPATRAFMNMPPDSAETDLRKWQPNLHYRLTAAPTASITNSLSIKSLCINASSPTITIDAGCELDIASGHFSTTGSSGNRVFKGGSLTSSSGKLYFLLRCNTVIENELTGNMDLVKGGKDSLYIFNGIANTYTGTTYVNSGDLYIRRPGGIPNDLVVAPGASTILQERAQPLAPNINITLRGTLNQQISQNYNGLISVENGRVVFTEVVDNQSARFTRAGTPGLVFTNGGLIISGQGRDTSDASARFLTDILCEAGASNQVLFTATVRNTYWVTLSENNAPATRVWTVQKAARLPPVGTPEMVVQRPLESAINADVELIKKGNGTLCLESPTGVFKGCVRVREGALFLNAYAPQVVKYNATGGGAYLYPQTPGCFDGLYHAQTCDIPHSTRGYAWIRRFINDTTVVIPDGTPAFARDVTFFACGPLGTADVFVENGATLGGAGGHTGNVFVEAGGTFAPGTALQPVGEFIIGGNPNSGSNLVFQTGGPTSPLAVWQVDLLATNNGGTDFQPVSIVHVAGDITLGGIVRPVFTPETPKRPKGEWLIGKFEGSATGKMSASSGFSVRVIGNEVWLRSTEPGTLFMVR